MRLFLTEKAHETVMIFYFFFFETVITAATTATTRTAAMHIPIIRPVFDPVPSGVVPVDTGALSVVLPDEVAGTVSLPALSVGTGSAVSVAGGSVMTVSGAGSVSVM